MLSLSSKRAMAEIGPGPNSQCGMNNRRRAPFGRCRRIFTCLRENSCVLWKSFAKSFVGDNGGPRPMKMSTTSTL